MRSGITSLSVHKRIIPWAQRITKEHSGATPPHGFGWHLSRDHVVHHAICRYSAVYCSVILMYPHTLPYLASPLGQSRSRSFVPQKSTMPLGSALIIADPCTTNHSYSIWSITSSSSLLHFLPCSEIVQDNKHLPCFIFLLGGRLPRLFILAKLKKKNIYKNYQAPRSSSNSFLPQLSILSPGYTSCHIYHGNYYGQELQTKKSMQPSDTRVMAISHRSILSAQQRIRCLPQPTHFTNNLPDQQVGLQNFVVHFVSQLDYCVLYNLYCQRKTRACLPQPLW
jgi:hypothetical protein